MGATFSRVKNWVAEVLTAGDLNAEFDNILNNLTPTGIDDLSADVTAMQGVTDPYPGASPSLATSLAGELQRIRYLIKQITGETQWYIDPKISLMGVYPVGSIYISTVSTNPNTLFGFGTWAAFGAGKVLVGLNGADSDFDTAEKTGGEKTHQLSVTEMPNHGHTGDFHNGGASGAATGNNASPANGNGGAGEQTVSINIQNTGGDGAHNNLQPYVVVYMWKRTA